MNAKKEWLVKFSLSSSTSLLTPVKLFLCSIENTSSRNSDENLGSNPFPHTFIPVVTYLLQLDHRIS